MDSRAGIPDGLIFVFAFSVDEIKDGFMSSGDKTHLRMKLRKRKPGREWGNDGQLCEATVFKYVWP